jgi:hypothetical protein
LALFGSVALADAATLSDGFADRSTESGLPVDISGTNVGAGKELGEPLLKPLAGARHTVWLEWEATEAGFVTVSTCGSGIRTVLAVYEGEEFGDFIEVDSATAFVGPECLPVSQGVTFKASAGSKYEIVIDGNAFFTGPPPSAPLVTEGPISLQIEATPPPPNDDFGDAAVLPAPISEEPGGNRFSFGSRVGYNWGATKEPGELIPAGDLGGASVWYAWTAPETGSARFSTCCRQSTRFAVFRGAQLGSLEQLFGGSQFVEMPVVGGTSYRIAVDGVPEGGTGAMASFSLHATMELGPNPGVPGGGGPPGSVSVPPPPDRTAPVTTIDRRRIRSKTRAANFVFSANEAGATFRCKLDARKAAPCTSPRSYSGLAPGPHTFRVFAVDAAGNADSTPATARFSIAPPKRRLGRVTGL